MRAGAPEATRAAGWAAGWQRGEGWWTAGRSLAMAAAAYLALAVGLWWQVWSTHPTTTTTCGCGDAARFLWFFAWPSFAIGHGHSLWYSTWLFHPTGFNLLDDTSVPFLATVLSPVTVLASPVAAMNAALTLAPALSALAMFVLLRRWVRREPAAFLGGLCYGFSPFVVTELAYNQLNIAFLAVLPLLALALDELVVRQRRSPYVVGALAGLLVVVQFFVGVEMLLIAAIAVLVGLVLLVAGAALGAPDRLRAAFGHAWRGLATAVVVATALLAYPVWYFAAGPAHLSGPIWSTAALDRYGNWVSSFWSTSGSQALVGQLRAFGGYQGKVLPGFGYLGAGALVVAVVGLVVFRRDRRLWLFAGVGVVTAALSLGPRNYGWAPWHLVERLPLVGNVVEVRFTAIVTLCTAVMVGIVADHAVGWVATNSRFRRMPARPAVRFAGAAVAAAVLVPTAVAFAPNLPLTARAVVLPRWFRTTGASLPPGRVVLAYPVPFSGIQVSMAWQAVNGMRYAMAGGGGPAGVADRAGAVRPGFEVLAAASLPLGPAPQPTEANLAAVRHALAAWQVTTVVVPDQGDLPADQRGRPVPYAVGFFTAALGSRPVHQESAWVWSSTRPLMDAAPAAVPLGPDRFAACTTGPPGTEPSPAAAASCVLASTGP